ncbi:MAG TPA: hypothetical protein PKO06_03870, partial [Candidatus Ozemobacteraceae bacterium]|nr:hypothetical protein [Candidatus Ozemobacteraceae bacterium]
SKGKKLTREAGERLATIEEHTALGSGFKIAMRDLQIRGAGNMLGEAQSGHIAAIGFSLYIELLEEAVKQLRGKAEARVQDAQVEIPVTALLPRQYIPDDETRIEFYARLARCRDQQLLDVLRLECEDRFGSLPPEARRLMRVVSLRVKATHTGVSKITRLPLHLKVEFDPARAPHLEQLFQQRSPWLRRLTFLAEEPNAVLLEARSVDADDLIDHASDLLEHLRSLQPRPTPTA